MGSDRVSLLDLERFTGVGPSDWFDELGKADSLSEFVVLRTCHRFEVYAATTDPDAAAAQLHATVRAAGIPRSGRAAMDTMDNPTACLHLLRVAAGLESMVLGEQEILGQVRRAYTESQAAGTVGPVLRRLFTAALMAGRRVRAETNLGRGEAGIPSLAARVLQRQLHPFRGRRVVVIGTGQAASALVRALRSRGAHVTIVGRQMDRAKRLASAVGGQAAAYEGLPSLVRTSDAVALATACPKRLVDAGTLDAWGVHERPSRLLILDLGNPRNVDPVVRGLPYLELIDLDGLRDDARRARFQQRSAAAAADRICQDEFQRLMDRIAEEAVEGFIRRSYEGAGRLAQREAARAARRLKTAAPEQRQILEAMAGSVAKKLMAGPCTTLRRIAREGDREALDAILRILGGEHPVPTDTPAKVPQVRTVATTRA